MRANLKTRAFILAVVSASMLFCHRAGAQPIVGSMDFGGVVTFDTMSLATATEVTNWNSSFVLQSSGNFTSVAPGTSVTMASDWIFNQGTPTVPSPGPATLALWNVGGFNFDLSSSSSFAGPKQHLFACHRNRHGIGQQF